MAGINGGESDNSKKTVFIVGLGMVGIGTSRIERC